jgi:hypothetical protein
VFVGGRGNTSGLSDKLPTEKGFKGCIRHLDINDHLYNFNVSPGGDSLKGIDVGKYGWSGGLLVLLHRLFIFSLVACFFR